MKSKEAAIAGVGRSNIRATSRNKSASNKDVANATGATQILELMQRASPKKKRILKRKLFALAKNLKSETQEAENGSQQTPTEGNAIDGVTGASPEHGNVSGAG
jgi:hypothetical protein